MKSVSPDTYMPIGVAVGVAVFVCGIVFGVGSWKTTIEIKVANAESRQTEDRINTADRLDKMHNFIAAQLAIIRQDVEEIKKNRR